MKFANNHHWKFKDWKLAFRIGLKQMAIVVFIEVINFAFMMNNKTAYDIIKDFLSLFIISQFDNYFFITVKSTMQAKLLDDGKVSFGSANLLLSQLLKIERTTSERN